MSVEHCFESRVVTQRSNVTGAGGGTRTISGLLFALASVDLVLLYLFQPIFTLALGILRSAALGVYSENRILK
jgi:hypothetical protein